ncbi:hypothetical protein DMC25_15935 [Caulobacter sp. D4A]|nr:hypothetical protein DMC25_15935 [Caulobacter sp. D4A]
MLEQPPSPHVSKRVVVHFPGFEPLDRALHHARYKRTAEKTARLWDFPIEVGGLHANGRNGFFDVRSGAKGDTETRIYVLEHDRLVRQLSDRPVSVRLVQGFRSAVRVALEGAAMAYFRHAWRFGLFFVFPFLLVTLALIASLTIASIPFWLALEIWYYPFGLLLGHSFFFRLFLPWSNRLHTLHLFSDWELAVAVARLGQVPSVSGLESAVTHWLDECVEFMRAALKEEADEYVITSHSMGTSMAAHALGILLAREPEMFGKKRVVFVTLGSAILQCATFGNANALRNRVGLIAQSREISWLDVQCLSDAVNFYKCPVVTLCGFPDAPQPKIIFIRLKNMLSAERYSRIRYDFLRIHRQYVLASDKRVAFDFTLLTAGPDPASSHAGRG